MTEVRYNEEIPTEVFRFDPPPGATQSLLLVGDMRRLQRLLAVGFGPRPADVSQGAKVSLNAASFACATDAWSWTSFQSTPSLWKTALQRGDTFSPPAR